MTTRIFSRFFRRCTKKKIDGFDVFLYKTHQISQFAVVVRKKDYKNAVDRNKIRRFVYHEIYASGALHLFKTGGYIFICKQTGAFDFERARESIVVFIDKMGRI